MALQKEIPTTYGVPASYWKASRIDLDLKNTSARSTCEGYASKEASENNATPMDSDMVSVRFFWSKEELEAAKPQKNDLQKELEAKEELTETEKTQLAQYQDNHAQQVDMWEKMTNPLLITQELAGAFAIISKYAYEAHKNGQKLEGAQDC